MRPVNDVSEAARSIESMLVRQLLEASQAFKGSSLAGSHIQTGMFVEALASAVAERGGLGLASLIERQLGDGEAGGQPGAGGDQMMDGLEGRALPRLPLPGARLPRPALPATPAPAESPPPITSNYGPRVDPMDGTRKFHTGIDMAGQEGAPIRAAAGGVVKSAGRRGGYGNAIEIDHGDGVTTLYAHASSIAVHEGQKIQAGQEVGRVGQTGRATGPHLHFEVRVDGRPVDPNRALKAYGIRADNTTGGKPIARL